MKTFAQRVDFSEASPTRAADIIAFLDQATARNERSKRRYYEPLHLRPGKAVLDVGCGTGDDVRWLYDLVAPGGRAVGVDHSPELVAEAKRRAGTLPVEFFVAPAEQLPFDDKTFDAVRSERTIQHVHDPMSAIEQFYRLLKPGGRVMVIDQDWETFIVAGGEKRTTRAILNHFTDSLANGWAGRYTHGMLRSAGFREVETGTRGGFLDYEFAHKMLLTQAADAAARDGSVTREHAERWLSDLRLAHERGEFFAFASTFYSSATR